MANYFNTLQDVAQMNGVASKDIINEVLLSAPELEYIPVRTVKGTEVKALVRKSTPKMHFRDANGGTPISKVKYQLKNIEAFNLSDVVKVDVQVADEYEEGADKFIAIEAAAHAEGGFLTMGVQNVYGTAFDKKGYKGLIEQLNDYMTLSADPQYTDTSLATTAGMKEAQADDSGTSAFLVRLGSDQVYQFYGNGKLIKFGPKRLENTAITNAAGETTYMDAYLASVNCKPGLAVVNPDAVVRIKNISHTNPLTDELLRQAARRFPRGAKYFIMMSELAAETLETWRTSKRVFATVGNGAGEQEIISADANKFRQAEIVITQSILDDETAASVKAAASANEFVRKTHPSFIK